MMDGYDGVAFLSPFAGTQPAVAWTVVFCACLFCLLFSLLLVVMYRPLLWVADAVVYTVIESQNTVRLLPMSCCDEDK